MLFLQNPLQQARRYAIHLAVVILLALGFLMLGVNNLLAPVARDEGLVPVRVVIPSGSSAGEIARLLHQEDLIKSEFLFRVLVRWEGVGDSLQAGEYQLSPDMSPWEIIEQMVAGDTIDEYIRVTIPEGYTVEQIADLLTREGLVHKEGFLELIQVGEFEFDFIKEIPPDVDFRLEGYLFPDTYHFRPDSSEREVVQHLLARFNQIITALEVRERAGEMGMDLHQVVTLASIVEREGRLQEEFSRIAGVFHNRLQRGMKLQSCATVQYVLGEPKEVLLYSDLEVPSPYNTYLHSGLPPGPIAAPGRDALLATIVPEETDYLYFVAQSDGSHVFSHTLEEHNRAKNQR